VSTVLQKYFRPRLRRVPVVAASQFTVSARAKRIGPRSTIGRY
jgi:hypothetical protein